MQKGKKRKKEKKKKYRFALISRFFLSIFKGKQKEKEKIMDTRKEEQRAELHRAIWQIANDLRGAVDGWDFKNYVLGTLFYRYISENLAEYINKNEWESGDPDFRYENIPDDEAEEIRDEIINEKGFFMLPSQLFCNVRKNAKENENLNETLENTFRSIEESSQGTHSNTGSRRNAASRKSCREGRIVSSFFCLLYFF